MQIHRFALVTVLIGFFGLPFADAAVRYVNVNNATPTAPYRHWAAPGVKAKCDKAIAVQNDGRVLVGGFFSTVKGVTRNSIARLNPDGTLDRGFLNGLSGASGSIQSVAVQGDDKVLVAGDFSAINGMPAAGIARLWTSADIPPRINGFNRSGAGVELSWDALPNRTYCVQYKDDLATPWTNLAGNVAGSVTGTASKTDTTIGNVSQRFYRLELLP